MRKSVYAGTFDPPTIGHGWTLAEGSKLFDELIWAIGIHPTKTPTFTIDERIEMMTEISQQYPNVTVDHFGKQYLVDYAESVGANYIIRGLRSLDDYFYERRMWHFNRKRNPRIITVFLMPPKELEDVSASFVKGLIGPENWEEAIKDYVSEPVYCKLLEKYEHVRSSK